MSAFQFENISASRTLRSASAALVRAQQRHEAAKDALAEHEADISAKACKLRELEAADANFRVATALGDPTQGNAVDAGELLGLQRDIDLASTVSAEFSRRNQVAREALRAAEAQHRKAAVEALTENAIEPARIAFIRALDHLKDAAVELMAAHEVAHIQYRGYQHYPDLVGRYGPSAYVMAAILDCGWGGHPGSVRPDWLPATGARLRPWDIPGVAETSRALRDAVEAAGVA